VSAATLMAAPRKPSSRPRSTVFSIPTKRASTPPSSWWPHPG
jgi:hypothetical protein